MLGVAVCTALLFAGAQAQGGQECASLYQQCGGRGYDGPTCCAGDATCLRLGDFYSQCILESIRESQGNNTSNATESDTPQVYGQCGGQNYDGDGSCPDGFTCVEVSRFFSQCVIETPGCVLDNNQCGGDTYVGPTECCEGLTCARPINATDDSYLQCRTSGPNVEEASNSLVDTSGDSPPASRSLPPPADTPTIAEEPALGPMDMAPEPALGPGVGPAPGPAGLAPDGGITTSRGGIDANAPGLAPEAASGAVTTLGCVLSAGAALMAATLLT